jgi:hypothetical protein
MRAALFHRTVRVVGHAFSAGWHSAKPPFDIRYRRRIIDARLDVR